MEEAAASGINSPVAFREKTRLRNFFSFFADISTTARGLLLRAWIWCALTTILRSLEVIALMAFAARVCFPFDSLAGDLLCLRTARVPALRFFLHFPKPTL